MAIEKLANTNTAEKVEGVEVAGKKMLRTRNDRFGTKIDLRRRIDEAKARKTNAEATITTLEGLMTLM